MTAVDPTARPPPLQGCGDIKSALCPRFFRANPQGLTLQRGYVLWSVKTSVKHDKIITESWLLSWLSCGSAGFVHGWHDSYAHPQAPHERGTNENANKLLRRKFPKGESMKAKTQRDATAAQHFINNYHRQILGGKTALQVFAALLPSLGFRNPQKVARFFGLAVA